MYKPIQTGSPDPDQPEDPEQVRQWVSPEVEIFCSYCFADPVAPYAADTERRIQPLRILDDFKMLQARHRVVLVEGAGGVRVPVARHLEMMDLIRMFQLPVVVVAHPQLGTINQTLLTVDALLAQRLEVKGVVISNMPSDPGDDPAVATLQNTLEPFLNVPLLGMLPTFDLQPGALMRDEVIQAFEALQILEK
jgi:dethiobiotin synthetase